ncbi:hypothetical protein [Eubacterium pyruvativorans]|uniref:hypothetical protein n=1 Tax=Eubacterium pyruvativorans TaxID=155865 RepID=UPI0015A528A9|nr:hypothetical protein [Eubacterium pyruvativorans]
MARFRSPFSQAACCFEEDAKSRANALASTLELNSVLLQKRPGNVSAGERQRPAAG